LTIYIVDDNHDLVEFIGCVLEEIGYTVHTFTHPEDALSHLKESHVQSGTLITDYNLPAMNGYQLHQNIHAIAPDVKTIVISGRNVSGDIKKLPFLQKPFSPVELIQLVREAQEAP